LWLRVEVEVDVDKLVEEAQVVFVPELDFQ
jgi:hypothetical protein